MTNHRDGAWALITASVLTCLLFAFHPTLHDPAAMVGTFSLSQIVHATALIAAPLMAYGFWEVATWLGLGRSTVRIALLVSLLSLVLTMNAAVVSNFVTPVAIEASREAAQAAHAPAAPAHSAARTVTYPHLDTGAAVRHKPSPLGRVVVAFNRGFAQVHVALLSIGIMLFGLALWGRSLLLAGLGAAVGAYPLIWQLSGTFSPETTTMPWIVFPQSAWLIAVAVVMVRARKKGS